MMIAFGILAGVVAVELILFQAAVQVVKSHDDYLRREAVAVWVLWNVAVLVPTGILVAFSLAAKRNP